MPRTVRPRSLRQEREVSRTHVNVEHADTRQTYFAASPNLHSGSLLRVAKVGASLEARTGRRRLGCRLSTILRQALSCSMTGCRCGAS